MSEKNESGYQSNTRPGKAAKKSKHTGQITNQRGAYGGQWRER